MCRLSPIIRAVTIERTHPLLTGGNPQWEGHHQELSHLAAPPLTKPGGTLGCVSAVLLRGAHGPLVLAGQSELHVQLLAWLFKWKGFFLLGSAQHVEAESVFSVLVIPPTGTMGCPDRSQSSSPLSAELQIRLLMARSDQSGISSSPKGLGVWGLVAHL